MAFVGDVCELLNGYNLRAGWLYFPTGKDLQRTEDLSPGINRGQRLHYRERERHTDDILGDFEGSLSGFCRQPLSLPPPVQSQEMVAVAWFGLIALWHELCLNPRAWVRKHAINSFSPSLGNNRISMLGEGNPTNKCSHSPYLRCVYLLEVFGCYLGEEFSLGTNFNEQCSLFTGGSDSECVPAFMALCKILIVHIILLTSNYLRGKLFW